MNPIELHRQYSELGADVVIRDHANTNSHVFDIKPDDYTGNLPFLKATAKIALTKPHPKYEMSGGGRCCSSARLYFNREESKC